MSDNTNNPQRRQEDPTLKYIADNMTLIHGNVSDLRNSVQESLKDISIALQSLVALEQKQTHQSITQQRFEKELDEVKKEVKELDNRTTAVEIAMPELKRTSSWIFSALLTVLGAASMFVGKMLGVY